MPDLSDGEWVEIKGSGAKPYVVKNTGGVFSCSCPAWRNQSLPIERRTCKHIRQYRGDDAETERLGAALAAPPPRKPAGEEKEGPPVLLAETWDNETNLVGWWMSEKLDGVRAYWDGKQFLSRQGNIYLAPDWFIEGLPPIPLDGELWLDRKAFQRTVSIVRRHDRPKEWKDIRFVVFDAPGQEGEFEKRLRFLDDLLSRHSQPYLHRLEHLQCRGLDHLRSELDRIETVGGEGLMMRQPGSLYVAGRSSTLLKVKRFHDAEAVVVGLEPGKGKHTGKMGALTVQLPDGTMFSIGTGFSDAERSKPPGPGAVVTFRYQELSDRGVPRFPSYVGLRDEADITRLADVSQSARKSEARKSPVPATLPAEESKRVFEFQDRFWEVTLAGSQITLRYGTESAPRTKTQKFRSADEAKWAMEDMIAEKFDDGFVEQGKQKPASKARARAPAPAPAATTGSEGKRYFEFVEGSSSKFWEVWVTDCRLSTRYGRIGSNGSTTIKDFPDNAAARKAADKLIAEKTSKGYVEKG
jgi:DNA ligase-1